MRLKRLYCSTCRTWAGHRLSCTTDEAKRMFDEATREAFDDDPDEWYAKELARLKERAPA